MQHRLMTLSLAAIFAVASNALAAHGGPKYGKGSGTNNTNNNGNSTGTGTTTNTPPVDHSASTDAKKKVAEATVELAKDNRALAEVVAKLRKEFQQKPEWIAAQNAVKDDQSKLDAAHNAVLAKLQKDPKYAALKVAKTKAETDRDTLQKDAGASSEEVDRVVKASFAAVEATTKIETDAMGADPAVISAKSQLADDNQKVTALLAEFDAANKLSPDWQAASKTVEDQQQVLADARKALAAAIAAGT